MSVVEFPGHHRARCTRVDCHGCYLCAGGLFSCTRCHGAEGALPTDCPGERMSPEEMDGVYEGRVDYRRGEGWVEGSSPHSPAHYLGGR